MYFHDRNAKLTLTTSFHHFKSGVTCAWVGSGCICAGWIGATNVRLFRTFIPVCKLWYFNHHCWQLTIDLTGFLLKNKGPFASSDCNIAATSLWYRSEIQSIDLVLYCYTQHQWHHCDVTPKWLCNLFGSNVAEAVASLSLDAMGTKFDDIVYSLNFVFQFNLWILCTHTIPVLWV